MSEIDRLSRNKHEENQEENSLLELDFETPKTQTKNLSEKTDEDILELPEFESDRSKREAASEIKDEYGDQGRKYFLTEEHTPWSDPETAAAFNNSENEHEFERQAEEAAEQILSEKDQLLKLVDEEFKDKFEEIRAEYQPEDAEREIEFIRQDILEKLHGKEAKTKFGKALKFVGSRFGIPALAGAGLKSLVKNTAKAYLGTASFGASIGVGAVVGGVWSGVESYRKEAYRLDTDKLQEQLGSIEQTNDNVKAAAIIDKARKHLKQGRINPLEANAIKVKLQRAEIDLRLRLDQENNKDKVEADRFMDVIEASKSSRKELRELEGIKNQKFEDKIELLKDNPDFNWKTVRNKAIQGAVVGAFGGAVGWAVKDLIDGGEVIRSWFGSGAGTNKVAEHVTQKSAEKLGGIASGSVTIENLGGVANGSVVNVSEQLQNVVGTYSQEVLNAHSHELALEAQRELLEAKFVVAAEKGEGATNAARDMLHDYLVNKEHLGGGIIHESLSKEELAKLIYTEDALKNQLLDHTIGAEHIVQPGQNFELSGSQIEAVWEKAQNLSPEQIESITKMLGTPEHHLSQKSLDFFTDDTLHNAGNEHWGEIAEHAKQLVQQLPKDQVDTLGLHAKAVVEGAAKQTWGESIENGAKTALEILAVAGLLAALGGAAVWAKRRWDKGSESDMDQAPQANRAETYEEHQEREEAETEDQENNEIPIVVPVMTPETEPAQAEPASEDKEESIAASKQEKVNIEEKEFNFQDFKQELEDKYKVKIFVDLHDREAAENYFEPLMKLVKKYPDFFENKGVQFKKSGSSQIAEGGIAVNILESGMTSTVFRKWIEEFIESNIGAQKFVEKMKNEHGVTLTVMERFEKEAQKFYRPIEKAIQKHPEFFQDKEILISNLQTKEDYKASGKRILINSTDTVEQVIKFLQSISATKNEALGVDWGAALGQQVEQERQEQGEQNDNPEQAEAVPFTKQELDKEAESKGLKKSLWRKWYDIMRDDGGVLNKEGNRANPLTVEEIRLIKNSLRSIKEFKVSNGTASFRHNVDKLKPSYEILLKKYNESSEESAERYFLKNVISELRQLNKELFIAVEKSVKKHNREISTGFNPNENE